MHKQVLHYVFPGFSDWETSIATAAIRMSGRYRLRFIGSTLEPVRSMGGLKVLPDLDFIPHVDLRDITTYNTAILLLPGGAFWQTCPKADILALVYHCFNSGIPVGAIGGATVFLGNHGFLDHRQHTSDSLHYLKSNASHYCGEGNFREIPATEASGLISAASQAPLSFAIEVARCLEIDQDREVAGWLDRFSNVPAESH